MEGGEKKSGKTEERRFKENDRVFEVLGQIEENYRGWHVVAGGLGVMGVLGEEHRVTHDVDLVIPEADLEKMGEVLEGLGFSVLDDNDRLLGSGRVYKKEGLAVDVVGGEISKEGLELKMFGGTLFIPAEGLGCETVLRGIRFNTFAAEVHYFLKNRATNRGLFNSMNPLVNRRQDEDDHKKLRGVIDPEKAKNLIGKGFSYKGVHPVATKIGQVFKKKR